jgi:2'-5' RNA ligase
MPNKSPLILTLMLDKMSHDYFTSLRNQYFPKHCNFLEAHLTLFHHLPANLSLLNELLEQWQTTAPLSLQITGIKNIGHGNIFLVSCKELQLLHKTMQHTLSKYLIVKDRQKLVPHITVQNKVTAFKAAATNDILKSAFKPFVAQGIGLASWQYLKGPWMLEKAYLFG